SLSWEDREGVDNKSTDTPAGWKCNDDGSIGRWREDGPGRRVCVLIVDRPRVSDFEKSPFREFRRYQRKLRSGYGIDGSSVEAEVLEHLIRCENGRIGIGTHRWIGPGDDGG